jgi:lipoprotein NlpI
VNRVFNDLGFWQTVIQQFCCLVSHFSTVIELDVLFFNGDGI